MSSDLSAEITAIATALLAVFAVATAWYARRAFLKQSQEVRAIEQQVKDEQELTKQQAELLKVQSDQLQLSRQQFDDQRQINARQAEVFELQSTELREALAERKHEAEQRRSAQAARVFISQTTATMYKPDDVLKTLDFDVPTERAFGVPASLISKVTVVNTSDQPVYDAKLRWHRGSASHGDPNPQPLGTIMPGTQTERSRDFPLDTNMAVSGAVLGFRDSAGITWMRRLDGGLTEQQ